ncbi:MAG: hypothetical protein ACK2TU_06145, partial [Anaerolineales bacterium]
MLKSLRGQLLISHILPTLIIIPLMGIALVYFLENKLILPSLENQLTDDAVAIAKIARAQPKIFSDSNLAGALLKDMDLNTQTRVMLLNTDGVLLASSDPEDDYRLNQALNMTGITDAQDKTISNQLD